jgi:hemerythrin superfamily protein
MNNRIPDDSPATSAYSGRSPEEIERDIEDTREELGDTLDELKSRLSPRERLQATAHSARELGQRFMHSARRSLVPDITTMIRLDHTHVLALFRRFKASTSMSRKQALVANACLALEIHARLEEEIFYPALREAAGHSEILDKSVPEHDEMRQLIRSLRSSDVGESGCDVIFHRLMRSVLHHVADEESVLLPLAERCLGERLSELGLQMAKRRVQLLRPDLGAAAITTARSFPVLTTAAIAGMLAVGVLVFRQFRGNGRGS